MHSKKLIPVVAKLDESTKERFNSICQGQAATMSSMIRLLINQYIDQQTQVSTVK